MTNASGEVTSWNDQSGNSVHAWQSAAGASASGQSEPGSLATIHRDGKPVAWFPLDSVPMRLSSCPVMKRHLAVVLAAILVPTATFAQNKVSLKITVEKQQKTRHQVTQQGKARSSGDVTVYTPQVTKQEREMSFDIRLQYLGARELKGLKVRYIIFGRDKRTRAVRPVGNGEREIEVLKSLETGLVTTDPVSFESRDISFNQGYGAEANTKLGQDYHGVAVAVYSGDERVASYFNPPGLSKEIEQQKLEF